MKRSSGLHGVVVGAILVYQQNKHQATIPLDTLAWFAWLETATSFTFKDQVGSFTAHKTRASNGRGGWYWYAYRRWRGRLFNLYLGTSEKLTSQRLCKAVCDLNARTRNGLIEQPSFSQAGVFVADSTPLLNTKLHIPKLPLQHISRPRPLALLGQGMLRATTLISTPAGYGKTTLLAEWASTTTRPVVWISLEASENKPSLFLTYLIEALQLKHPDIEKALSYRSLEQAKLHDIMVNLLNCLATIPQETTIILDNYHVISNLAIHNTVKFLLDHLPAHVHVVIATRGSLPFSLTRQYVSGQVTELHADVLRFTTEEMYMLLTSALPSLTPDEIASLEQLTEGWAAGLQLAIQTALQEHHAPTHSIAAFAAHNRYLQSYMIKEVLAYQPKDVQTFLMYTVFLERLNSSLCGFVTGQTNAQELLEQLAREQLFLFPLDEQKGWYRYHHLFAETMRHYLEYTQPALFPLLHNRVSQWFEEQGMLEDAIDHSLLAQDVERAVRLIGHVAYSLLAKEEILTLQRWFAALPAQVVRADPQLCVIAAWLIFLTTQTPSFLAWLDAAEEALHSCEEAVSPVIAATLQGEIVALRAANKLYLSDINTAITTCKQVLASLPPDNLYARSLLLLMLGLAYQRGVNMSAAAQALSEAISSSQAIGHGLLLPYVMTAQAELYELQGHPFEAKNVYQQVLKLTNGRTGHPTGIAYASLGYLFWEWHNLDTARHYLLQAWDIGIQADNNNIVSETALWLVQLELDQGRTSEANYWLQQWERFIQKAGTYEVLSIVAALRAQISLEQGHLDDALLWMQNHMPSSEDDIVPRHEITYFVQVRTLIEAGRTNTDTSYMQQAMTLLERLRQTAEGVGRTKTLIGTLIYQALVYYFLEDLEGALAVLERALLLAEPGRYIRVFVVKGDPMLKLLRRVRDRYKAYKSQECPINLAYVRRLLATFPQPAARIEPMASSETYPLLEPLSSREREVLRLVAAGRKNQEIAKELVVVTGTVKAHINSIYRKLAVNSRMQAVARARALHLL
jgi:LuxR family maltose regulon positive regulatory protein